MSQPPYRGRSAHPYGAGWSLGPPAPPPPRNHALVGVLIVLVAATIAVAAFGGVLLFQREGDSPVATPPQTSTLTPRPSATPVPPTPGQGTPSQATSAPVTEQPTEAPTTQAPTTQAPTSQAPTTQTPTTQKPTTQKPTTQKPTTQQPTTQEPTPKPTNRPPTPQTAEDYLVRNPLYAHSIPDSDCSQPPRPLPKTVKADRTYLKNLVACMGAAYAAPVKAAGFTLTRPAVYIYTGTIQTPCGQGLAGYPVFYCGANESIYSSAGSTADYGSTLRLGGYWIVFHEYAHHVQQRIGVLDSAYTREEPQLQISRRIELQADCYMAMTSSSVRSVKLTRADRAQMTTWRNAVPDEIHGKSASQLYWINRGFATARFARCTTWTATNHIG